VIGTVAPIAIVGVALVFPGANDALAFHDLTLSDQRMFRLDPTVDLDPIADTGTAGTGTPGTAEAPGATAWHRLAARTAAEALADAGLNIDWAGTAATSRARTGVLIAGTPTLPGQRLNGQPPGVGEWVRDHFGLAGVADPPDQGCSLRAVAAACEVLARGERDLMLAGGAGAGTTASSWRKRAIRVYDARPTGVIPGEGCGMVALMRADDAREAGLPVYAEIAGWSHSVWPAGGDDQAAVIRAAYRRAGVDPADVQFVEGHGAATAAEDLAELTALLAVLGQRPRVTPSGRSSQRGGCALGAVSASIGGTGGAAGVAALLKTALAMTAATIPPSIGCVEPHELLRGARTPFRLPRAPEEWPESSTLLAGVNSLGTLGSAEPARSGPTHLVLRRAQEASRPGRRRRPRAHAVPRAGTLSPTVTVSPAATVSLATTVSLAATLSPAATMSRAGRVLAGAPASGAVAEGGGSLPYLLVRRALARHSTEVRKLLSLTLMGPRDRGELSRWRQASLAARAMEGSQSGRSGKPDVPSACSFTPRIWWSCTTLRSKPSMQPAM
jgi:acyl transferase domain-containing protein